MAGWLSKHIREGCLKLDVNGNEITNPRSRGSAEFHKNLMRTSICKAMIRAINAGSLYPTLYTDTAIATAPRELDYVLRYIWGVGDCQRRVAKLYLRAAINILDPSTGTGARGGRKTILAPISSFDGILNPNYTFVIVQIWYAAMIKDMVSRGEDPLNTQSAQVWSDNSRATSRSVDPSSNTSPYVIHPTKEFDDFRLNDKFLDMNYLLSTCCKVSLGNDMNEQCARKAKEMCSNLDFHNRFLETRFENNGSADADNDTGANNDLNDTDVEDADSSGDFSNIEKSGKSGDLSDDETCKFTSAEVDGEVENEDDEVRTILESDPSRSDSGLVARRSKSTFNAVSDREVAGDTSMVQLSSTATNNGDGSASCSDLNRNTGSIADLESDLCNEKIDQASVSDFMDSGLNSRVGGSDVSRGDHKPHASDGLDVAAMDIEETGVAMDIEKTNNLLAGLLIEFSKGVVDNAMDIEDTDEKLADRVDEFLLEDEEMEALQQYFDDDGSLDNVFDERNEFRDIEAVDMKSEENSSSQQDAYRTSQVLQDTMVPEHKDYGTNDLITTDANDCTEVTTLASSTEYTFLSTALARGTLSPKDVSFINRAANDLCSMKGENVASSFHAGDGSLSLMNQVIHDGLLINELKLEIKSHKYLSKLLVPLTEQERINVKRVIEPTWKETDPKDFVAAAKKTVIFQCKGDKVTAESMSTLGPGNWFDDSIITFYLKNVLASRDKSLGDNKMKNVYHSSFFLQNLFDEKNDDKDLRGQYNYNNVKSWTRSRCKERNIFGMDYIICPYNDANVHWSVGIISMKEKRIYWFDSKGGNHYTMAQGLIQYVRDEYKAEYMKDMDVSDWRVICSEGSPQTNGECNCTHQCQMFIQFMTHMFYCVSTSLVKDDDCGVWVCMYCHFVSLGYKPVFVEEHINHFRQMIALSFINHCT